MPDESRFCYQTNYESIGFSSHEEPPEREQRMISPPQVMLTVLWNQAPYRVIDVLPKGLRDCSVHDLFYTMDLQLVALPPDEWHPFRKLVIYEFSKKPGETSRILERRRADAIKSRIMGFSAIESRRNGMFPKTD
jgi:hypothetical protein